VRAVEKDDRKKVLALLARGVPADDHNRYGHTALMSAAFKGDLALCKKLIEVGADVNRTDYREPKLRPS
jgi:ankyrin repeat protein